MKRALKIHDKDTVAVALDDLKQGESFELGGNRVTLCENIGRGHKFSLIPLQKGAEIVKYGFPIGHATREIAAGAWVHSHNMSTNLSGEQADYRYQPLERKEEPPSEPLLKFQGFRRADGSVGIRNDLWIIPTVGCVNGTAELIAERFRQSGEQIHAEDIKILKHCYGCSQLGDDLSATRTILADLSHNPNAGGVLILSLGCENNTLTEFQEALAPYGQNRVRFLIAQEEEDEIAKGAACLSELNRQLASDRREPVPLSELKVGMKCGGSDGLSGITANPFIGLFTDFLVSQGGTSVLTEVPEMFGAETILMDRAQNQQVFAETVDLIQNFKKYFTDAGQPVSENPSPGNKAGGITTLEEKSLGCIQKGGSATVTDVLPYGGRLKQNGLNLLCAPGNDLVSSSALAAAGCQMVLFSTGRGTPFGTVVPTVKLSTNTKLFQTKPNWIDFDAGQILAGTPKDDLLREFLQLVIRFASGEPTCNEKNKFSEIAIWKNSVTL